MIGPAITLIPLSFSLPLIVAGFVLNCENLENSWFRYLLIISYCATLTPQWTSFFLYISPSSFYMDEWRKTRVRRWIDRRLHPPSSVPVATTFAALPRTQKGYMNNKWRHQNNLILIERGNLLSLIEHWFFKIRSWWTSLETSEFRINKKMMVAEGKCMQFSRNESFDESSWGTTLSNLLRRHSVYSFPTFQVTPDVIALVRLRKKENGRRERQNMLKGGAWFSWIVTYWMIWQ